MTALRRSKSRKSPPKIGLALGGGGARGLSHIGILRELTEMGIQPEIICGTSIGALIGAASVTGHLDFVENTFKDLRKRDFVRHLDVSLMPGLGLVEGRRAMDFFRTYMGDMDIESLETTYAALATDVNTGEEVCLSDGNLWDAVRASISLPGIFRPVKLHGRWLVDGGLVNPVPVSWCRKFGADLVIAVNLSEELVSREAPKPDSKRAKLRDKIMENIPDMLKGPTTDLIAQLLDPTAPPGMFDILADSINIMQTQIARSRLKSEKPDAILTPDVGHVGVLEFHCAEEAIEAGHACVKEARQNLEDSLGL